MSRCAVAGCSNRNDKRKKYKGKLKYYSFPKQEPYRGKWMKACGRDKELNLNHAKICSAHFTQSCFFVPMKHKLMNYSPKGFRDIKEDSIPTENLPKDIEEEIVDVQPVVTITPPDIPEYDISNSDSEDVTIKPAEKNDKIIYVLPYNKAKNKRSPKSLTLKHKSLSNKSQIKESCDKVSKDKSMKSQRFQIKCPKTNNEKQFVVPPGVFVMSAEDKEKINEKMQDLAQEVKQLREENESLRQQLETQSIWSLSQTLNTEKGIEISTVEPNVQWRFVKRYLKPAENEM